jgi:PTH1 family peptidyl-tRNA hydrolase
MVLVIGLGNPGRKYRGSPHNAGYEVVDRLAARHGISLAASRKTLAEIGEGEIGGVTVALMKPTTYMNLSGEAVATFLKYRELDKTRDLLVVSDDINLLLGRLRLRGSGSHGGHNGLRSLIHHLGTTEFPRLRLGVYPPGADIRDRTVFVLTPLWGEEK